MTKYLFYMLLAGTHALYSMEFNIDQLLFPGKYEQKTTAPTVLSLLNTSWKNVGIDGYDKEPSTAFYHYNCSTCNVKLKSPYSSKYKHKDTCTNKQGMCVIPPSQFYEGLAACPYTGEEIKNGELCNEHYSTENDLGKILRFTETLKTHIQDNHRTRSVPGIEELKKHIQFRQIPITDRNQLQKKRSYTKKTAKERDKMLDQLLTKELEKDLTSNKRQRTE